MEKSTIEKLQRLLSKYGPKFYCAYDWDLTDEEKKLFENSEVGDEVHIETPMVPVVIDDGDGFFIGMYTDKKDIPKEFLKEKTIQFERIESFLVSCKASATVLKSDVSLVLNPYSQDEFMCIFNMKEVDDLYYELLKKSNARKT